MPGHLPSTKHCSTWCRFQRQADCSRDHVSSILTSCSSSLYALRVLRDHGLQTSSLNDVFRATILTEIRYCAAAGRSRNERRTGSRIQTRSRFPSGSIEIPAETCGGGLWAARPTTDIASQYTTADKPEVTASCTSQEVTTSSSTPNPQTLPVHTGFCEAKEIRMMRVDEITEGS